MAFEAQVVSKCLLTCTVEWLFEIMSSKVGHTDLVFDQGSLVVGLCKQDYKCLCSSYDLCHPD